MHRYSGTLFIIKYLFLQYVSLAGPLAAVALATGLLATILGSAMLFARPSRRNTNMFSILAILPLLIGILGTVLDFHNINEGIALEKKAGIPPSARRYINQLEYGYSEELLRYFPFIVGCASSIPPLVLAAVLKRRRS